VNLIWVVLGAAAGAPARYLIDRALQARRPTAFPLGTFAANIAACLILGFVVELVTVRHAPLGLQLGLGTGFAATLSTYSTFSYENVRLAEDGRRALAGLNIAASVVVGILAAFIGVGLAAAV
jgi:CrcB protein